MILVVDEALSLRDFFRGLNSATLTMSQVEGAMGEARAMLMNEAARSLETLRILLKTIYDTHEGWLLDKRAVIDTIRDEQGTAWLQNLVFELSSCSGAAWGSIAYERRFPSLILRVSEFLTKLSSSSRGVLVKWEDTFGIIDPNPVGDLARYLHGSAGSILMSATVNPSAVFMENIGQSDSSSRGH